MKRKCFHKAGVVVVTRRPKVKYITRRMRDINTKLIERIHRSLLSAGVKQRKSDLVMGYMEHELKSLV